ncbi:MAG: hypothetical protein ACNS62_21955 [Candidatus Cyclobacteriaceae bacterium M3_2C_046]
MAIQTYKAQDKWLHLLLPALAMMLAWGFRGHIGGGPFGAMIPGAMLALSLSLLLSLPASASSVVLVFGVFGIGMGGEMTYGQTLGFLRDPDTLWWGSLATTLKGSVWGLLGGVIISLGFVFKRLPAKKILIGFVIMMAGMLAGFKLINEPMILYFSDPENPRSESWAALLFGAIALLGYLKFISGKEVFKIISRFALFGWIGGALGFGLGSLWIALGSQLPDVIFSSWWKAMEFSFGFLLGGFLAYASWLDRDQIKAMVAQDWKDTTFRFMPLGHELIGIMILSLFIYLILPYSLETFSASLDNAGFLSTAVQSFLRILMNYAFYGFLLVVALIYFPKIAWQAGITLTFAHAALDQVMDHLTQISFFSQLFLIMTGTFMVALLTAIYSRRPNAIRNLFLLLIWSCLAISMIKIFFHSGNTELSQLSWEKMIIGRFFVDLFFLLSSVIISWLLIRKIDGQPKNKFEPLSKSDSFQIGS